MKNHPVETCYDPASSFDEEIYSAILNSMDDSFFLILKDFRIIYTNKTTHQKMQAHFGRKITPDTNILDLTRLERRPQVIQLYNEVLKGHHQIENTVIEQNGYSLFVENHYKPVWDKNNKVFAVMVISRDVTKETKAEAHLKEAEERWRFALEGGHQGVWDWNVQTGQIYFSDAYKKMYGYQPDELNGNIDEWEKMIHPEDQLKMQAATKEHLAGEDPYHESTYRIKSKDGHFKWVLGRGMLIRDANGSPVRMIGTHTDITKQVIAEETYKVLFYSNPLPLWTYDVETLRFLTVNNAAISHYGYSKEEFLSMTVADIRPAEDVDAFLQFLLREKTSRQKKYINRHVKKNGEIIYVELSTHTLENTGNRSELVAVHDMTSKIKAEEELNKSNERFVLASRATSDAIYDWNLITNELYWGEGLQTLFGYAPTQVTVSRREKLVHPDDRSRVYKKLYNTLHHSEARIWKAEYRFAKADGNFSYVSESGSIIRDEQQKAIRMIGSLQDISDRKYTEEILSLERSVFELSTLPDMDLEEIVTYLLQGIEQIHDDAFTSVLLLRDDQTVEPFVAPRVPELFFKSLRGLKIGPEAGTCGTAMWLKKTVITENIEASPLWENYRHLAIPYEFRACWSLPVIHSSGKVMGSLAIYFKKAKKPSPLESNTLERIRNILRILMEHHWSLREIKNANERFDIIMRATHDLIWDWNLENNVIYRYPIGLMKVYGVEDNKSIEKIDQWLAHIHPDDLRRVQKVIADIIQARNENIFDVEYRFKRNDGTYSYVYDRGMILRNSEGKPVRMIGAAQDITERKRLEEELLRNELEKRKAINQASVDSQEQERTEIGKELHDNVNQILTTTKLYLELALSNEELKDELIAKSNRNIISVINEIRQLSRSLMDPTIGDLGLVDSINDLIENINLTGKLQVSLEAEKRIEFLLLKNHKLTIFRIIQEALNNTIRHAHASRLLITLAADPRRVKMTIEDNGVGFDPAIVKMGAGLKNIQNRAYLINGSYEIQAAPQKGCKIIIKFPIIK